MDQFRNESHYCIDTLLTKSVLIDKVIISLLYHCCGLVGNDVKTPDNPTIQNVIRALFTPYLTKAISRNTPNEVRSTLSTFYARIKLMLSV